MTAEDKPLRLFLAVAIPPDELRRVWDETSAFRRRWPQARWAPLDNQHVTLKFLGSTPRAQLDEVDDVVAGIASARASSHVLVSGLGVFPGPSRARVLWAGLRDDEDLLASLANGLASALAPLGYEPEKRRFTPHLTLARFRTPVRVDKELLVLDEGEPFPVDEVLLFRSHLSPKGARYEVVNRFPLRPGNDGDA